MSHSIVLKVPYLASNNSKLPLVLSKNGSFLLSVFLELYIPNTDFSLFQSQDIYLFDFFTAFFIPVLRLTIYPVSMQQTLILRILKVHFVFKLFLYVPFFPISYPSFLLPSDSIPYC